MTAGREVLVVASVNWRYGGVDPDGSKDRWRALTGFLQAEAPDVVLCQEFQAASPSAVHRHLQDTASELGMTAAVLGPPAPGAASGSEHHTAILVRDTAGLRLLDTGPAAAYLPWDHVPWAEALLDVPGLPNPVRFYSIHLPYSSDVWQKHLANKLASRIAVRAEHGEQPFAVGDWNCLAPADNYTQAQLAAMPARVRPARIRVLPDGTLQPILDVHQVLTGIGLADVAAVIPPARRDPQELTPSGTAGGRGDRAYATPGFAAAVSCRQVRTGATDHDALVLTTDVAAAATAGLPGALT